jgi:pullulanase
MVVAVLMISSFATAADGPLTVEFQMAFPSETVAGRFCWGVTRDGLELAGGCEEDGICLLGEGVASSDGERQLFTVKLPAGSLTDGGSLRAHVCLNQDRWHSYRPSFGDWFQVVDIERDQGRMIARFAAGKWQQREATGVESILTVHYHRFSQDYANTTLWTWDEHLFRAPPQNELYPVGTTDFGLVFQIDTSLYGKPGHKVGLLPRRNLDWQYKDNGDRLWAPEMGMEVYLVQGKSELYTSRPDVSPHVAGATLDGDALITVRFTHRIQAAQYPVGSFHVMDKEGHSVRIDRVKPVNLHNGRTDALELHTAEPLDFVERTYRVEVKDMGEQVVRVWRVLHDEDRFHDPDAKLGANYTSEATAFRVFAPSARSVDVVVAPNVEGNEGVVEHEMTRTEHGIWEARVKGDLHGRFYAYKLGGGGFDPDEEITDIYARCTQNRHVRSMIVDLERTNPPGFEDDRYKGPESPVDAVIYEMHVRDLTISPDSGVEMKGRYLGLTESGTHLPGDADIKTGLDHLVEMGVTHVQILPIQDFDNDETDWDAYNWGYMPVHFNSPDGWYATEVDGFKRITEFKQLVQALHKRNIGVIMDVVYNHTALHAPFEKLVPGYYFRMKPSGDYWNGSGCGNEFKSENPMARKFIVDSLRYWVEEYHVDGFRFDLMGLMDMETMEAIRDELKAIKPDILLHGEPWTGGETPLDPITNHEQIRGSGIGAFNDHFRDAIKGDRDDGPPGYIQVGDRIWGVKDGLLGAIEDWTVDPIDAIQYFEAHDNLTAWDKLTQSVPHVPEPLRKRMMRFGSLILLTAQGTAFLHSGQEMCRTKQGSSNSYNLPDEFNQINWSWKKEHRDLYEYVRGLIALRKAHPAFRLRTREDVKSRVSFGSAPDPRCLVYQINGEGLEGESAREIVVLLNGRTQATPFVLPPGTWRVYADEARASLEPLRDVSGAAELPAHSGLLLMR